MFEKHLLKKLLKSSLTDTGEDSKLVHRRKRPKVDTLLSSLFFRRVRATSMTQRRVENNRVHFWTFSPVSVKGTKNNNPGHDSKKPRRGLETNVENEVMSFASSLLQNDWIN